MSTPLMSKHLPKGIGLKQRGGDRTGILKGGRVKLRGGGSETWSYEMYSSVLGKYGCEGSSAGRF